MLACSGIYFYGLLAIQSKKNCLIAEEVSTMTEQVVKSKDLRRQTKGVDGRFFADCVINIIEKAVSICVIIPQNRQVKKFQFHIIDHSSEHNRMGISYQNNWKALKRKRLCKPHARMVSKGFANFIPKEDRPANRHIM